MNRTAVILGVTGQDGAYLAELLLAKGYTVYGTHREAAPGKFWRLEELGIGKHPALKLIQHDMTDYDACVRLLQSHPSLEAYNVASRSSVSVPFDDPVGNVEITGVAVVKFLEAIRIVNPKMRFFQACSAEMFGQAPSAPQSETTPFSPRSPYGAAKLLAHWMTVNYREAHGIFGCTGILFNHESPLRSREFVTRKISESVAKIRLGKLDVLELGNLDAQRDWGYAKEYVEAMWLMLQAEQAGTYVLATGRAEPVREFTRLAFQAAGLKIDFDGSGVNEYGVDSATGKTVVRVNPAFFRPVAATMPIGDPALAESLLGWKSRTSLEELCTMMVESDLRRLGREETRSRI